jgi:hypothetical protein
VIPGRRVLVAALAVAATLGAAVPAASASTFPTPHFAFPTGGFSLPVGFGFPTDVATAGGTVAGPAGPCGSTSASQGNGSVAGTTAQTCLGAGGLSFVGPAIGQISSIVGPTIIGPTNGVVVIQSAGNVGGG